jgi:hypothetical protein
MRETPRTDKAVFPVDYEVRGYDGEPQSDYIDVVYEGFARELERELAQRTAALNQMTVHRNATIEQRDITQQVLNGITVALSQRTADLAQRTAELAQRTAERDEARREVCLARSNPLIVEHHLTVAIERGWNCFDEKQEADDNNKQWRETNGKY